MSCRVHVSLHPLTSMQPGVIFMPLNTLKSQVRLPCGFIPSTGTPQRHEPAGCVLSTLHRTFTTGENKMLNFMPCCH